MAKLNDDMKDMIERLRLCFVATVSPDGKPNLSPKGSLTALDDDTLAFADIASPNTMRNLKQNPYIEINMVDPFLRRGYRFKGVAEIIEAGDDVYKLVAEELWTREGPQYPVNAVVKIQVDEALAVLSPAYMFNEGVKEGDVKRVWVERYGLQQAASTAAETKPTVATATTGSS